VLHHNSKRRKRNNTILREKVYTNRELLRNERIYNKNLSKFTSLEDMSLETTNNENIKKIVKRVKITTDHDLSLEQGTDLKIKKTIQKN